MSRPGPSGWRSRRGRTGWSPTRWSGWEARTQGPDPFDLLAASLGACTAIVVANAARARALPISRVEVRVSTKFNKVAARPGDEQLALVELRRSIHIEADVSPDDLAWLYARGTDCPVSRALRAGVAIRTTTGALTGRRRC